MIRKSLSLLLLLGTPILFGACSDEPVLIIDRKSFDFGEMEVGKASGEQLFTVRNASPHDVESVGVSIEGSESFAITSNTCEKYLSAGMECEVRVRFLPRLGGPQSAHLKASGAPSVGQTELQGIGFAWVEVTSMPPGSRVVAGDDSFTCTQPCRQAVHTAELTLYAAPDGFPTWSAACASAPRGGCLLHLDASKSVALDAHAPLYKWEVRRSRPPVTVAFLPGSNGILVQDDLGLTSLDLTGREQWSLPLDNIATLAVNNTWNFWLLSYNGTVSRYGGDGNVLWTYRPQGPLSARYLAVDPGGYAYVLLTQGSYDTAQVMKLIALSPEGAERWSAVFNEAPFNLPTGLSVTNAGDVYVGGATYNRSATTQQLVLLNSNVRKFTPAGALIWTKELHWAEVAVEGVSGEFVYVINNYMSPGGFEVAWYGADGNRLWNAQLVPGAAPGVVTEQVLPVGGGSDLLVGGYEVLPGTPSLGRGWFARVGDRTSLKPGPVTYIESPDGHGALVSGLAFAAEDLVVSGSFGSAQNTREGFVRLYDSRVLTVR